MQPKERGMRMSRIARKESATGLYHVVFKGVNHERVFETDAEKRKIRLILQEKMKEYSLEIYAYCIMPTHIHLLIHGQLGEISKFLCRCEIVYAMQYNDKKKRNGHLFQNRFFSEAIEDEKYFWNCINYIHNNPVKAEIVDAPEKYEWSSYLEYTDKIQLITAKTLKMVHKRFRTIEDFEKFSLKNEQTSWFVGTEEEMKMQKSALILKKLSELNSLRAFENRNGKVKYSEATRQMSRELRVTQKEIMNEIEKLKSEI